MTIISGHQPTYLPWPGLFHKLYLSDKFVYMDTVQYLEQDWNNRNRIRTPHGWTWLTVPIDRKQSKGSQLDAIIIRGHEDPEAKNFWQKQHWKSILANYRKADFFPFYEADLAAIYVDQVWEDLVSLCWAQFLFFARALSLDDREIVRMSERKFSGKKDVLVLDHCKQLKGDAVVFGSQGKDYVDLALFEAHAIKVYFQNYQCASYQQRFPGFEPGLSMLDMLMNLGPNAREMLSSENLKREDLKSGKHWV